MKTHIITTIIIIAAIFIPYALGTVVQPLIIKMTSPPIILTWIWGAIALAIIFVLILIYAKLRTEIKDLIE